MLLEILRERTSEQDSRIGEIIEGHRSLADRMKELEAMIDKIEEGFFAGRNAFVAVARRFIAFEKQHIHDDEHYLFSAALKHLSPDEWAWVNSSLGDAKVPLFGEAVTQHFAQLRQSIFATDHTYRVPQ